MALDAQPRYEKAAMKSAPLNVFIVYTDQEATHFAVYAATSADQALALHRRENPSRVEWEGQVKAVLEATSDGVPRRLRVISGSVGGGH